VSGDLKLTHLPSFAATDIGYDLAAATMGFRPH
jgi:hypothetical protein